MKFPIYKTAPCALILAEFHTVQIVIRRLFNENISYDVFS